MSDGPKLTRNQEIVFGALMGSDVPLSAYEILDLEEVRAQGLKAPLTIYRALDKLREHGLVHRIESLNAFVACDRGPHSEPVGFMSCERCKKTVELPVGACEEILRSSAEADGFKLDRITVEVSGRCTSCASGD
ncbi:MAG: Fur family transcriptional regulator [Hyphomicrobiales bacterium]